MMRRWTPIVHVLLLLALLSLAGCADLATLFLGGEEDSFSSAFVEPTPDAVFPAEISTAARILSRGELVVGVRYDLEPFSFVTPDSELAGLEVDLARELARRWLGNPDAVRFRQVRSDSAYQHLAEGTVDVVFAGLTHTQEDDVRADFSPPYFINGLALLTFPDAEIQSLADLGDRTVGVVTWTRSRAAIQATAPVTPTFVNYGNFLEVVEALRTRQVLAYGDQRHRLERARRMVNGTVIVGQATQEPVSMIYRQNDPFFHNLVHLTFQDIVADGTRDALYSRWLPDVSPPTVPLWPGTAPIPPLSASPHQRSSLDVIGRIRARGTVMVGYFVDRWPYSSDRADGVPTGFEVRLLERIVEQWLGSREAMTLVPVTEADALPRLAQGELDILVGGWVHTRELELTADLSIPILDDGVSILSLSASPVSALAELAGQSVGVVVGSAAEAAVPSLSQGVGLSALGYPNLGAAVAALQSGEIAAVLSERRPALSLQFTEAGYTVTPERYTYRPVALVLPEGDSAFRDLVNHTLAALQNQGIYQEVYDLWFDDPPPRLDTRPGRPSTPLLIAN